MRSVDYRKMRGRWAITPRTAFRAAGTSFCGEPLPRLRSRKEPWLLALLVLHAGRELERRWLAGLLWPESREESALINLRGSLLDLRRALGSVLAITLSAPPHALSTGEFGAASSLIAEADAMTDADRHGAA